MNDLSLFANIILLTYSREVSVSRMNNVQRPTGCSSCGGVPSGQFDTGRIIDDGQAYNPLLPGTLAMRTERERTPCRLHWLYPPTLRSNSRVYPTPPSEGVYMQPYMNKEYTNVIPDGVLSDYDRYVKAVEAAKKNEVDGVAELAAIHNVERKRAEAAQSTQAVGMTELAANTPTPSEEMIDVAEAFSRPPLVIPIQPIVEEGVETGESVNRFVQERRHSEAEGAASAGTPAMDTPPTSSACIGAKCGKKIFGMSMFAVLTLLILLILFILVVRKYTNVHHISF